MKRTFCFLYAIFHLTITVVAQGKRVEMEEPVAGKKNMVSFGTAAPLGEFSETHSFGFNLSFTRATQRFGVINKKQPNKSGFTYEAGLTYFIGKTERTTGVANYHYRAFTVIHAFGGWIFRPTDRIQASILAGPGMGIYDGNTRFEYGARLEGSYWFSEQWAIGPAINFLKEGGSAPLAMATVYLRFAF